MVELNQQDFVIQRKRLTSIMGSWPLTPTLSFVILISTTMSLPFRFPGTSTLISRSPIVWVHLQGRAACSAASLARAASSAAVSSVYTQLISTGNMLKIQAARRALCYERCHYSKSRQLRMRGRNTAVQRFWERKTVEQDKQRTVKTFLCCLPGVISSKLCFQLQMQLESQSQSQWSDGQTFHQPCRTASTYFRESTNFFFSMFGETMICQSTPHTILLQL